MGIKTLFSNELKTLKASLDKIINRKDVLNIETDIKDMYEKLNGFCKYRAEEKAGGKRKTLKMEFRQQKNKFICVCKQY